MQTVVMQRYLHYYVSLKDNRGYLQELRLPVAKDFCYLHHETWDILLEHVAISMYFGMRQILQSGCNIGFPEFAIADLADVRDRQHPWLSVDHDSFCGASLQL